MPIRYWPYFCEESIWHLCGEDAALGSTSTEKRRVVFITNVRRRVAIRKQRACGGGLVLWDYHVVLLDGGKVWDLDSTLGCPVDLDVWIQESFYPLVPGYGPRFRVVDASTYRSRFASDRSHMLDAEGLPLKPPPPWPRIGEGMTLMDFVDLETPFVGEVLDLESFRRLE
jgi:hypothetical protein